ASQGWSPRSHCIGSWRLRSIAWRAAFSSWFGLTDACPGNSRCQRGLGALRRAAVPSVWLRCWHKTPMALTRRHTACVLFGIADLVVAITMGAMTSPGRAHLLAFEAPNLLMSSYPLVMVPTFAVPLALMLHGLVLWRLRRGAASAERLARFINNAREGGQV